MPYEGFVVEIADGTTPSIAWGQWLGGSDDDYVFGLAVIGDEIYAGGYTSSKTNWESITWQGSYSGGYDGFVVEIADNDTTNIPSIAWGQWLGGSGTDYVEALAVNGDEIHAAGYAGADSTTWGESITWQGSFNGAVEGYLAEIADDGGGEGGSGATGAAIGGGTVILNNAIINN